MPIPTDAATVTGRLSMRAMTAAASGASSDSAPLAWPRLGPRIWLERMAATPDSPPASTHTIRDRCRTGTPRSRARSFESAAARTATPVSLRPKNQARAPSTTGVATRARTSLASKTSGPTVNDRWNGAVKPVMGLRWAKARGSSTSAAPRIWATPTVATVRIRRGAVKKRRTTTASISAPDRRATTRPRGTAR